MTVSIIIPVYNVEKYLKDCLDSVINQTYKDLEIICVNDGSKDNSLKILEEYQQKDNRVKVIDQGNQGVSTARNTGVQNATGNYITFLDSDDWISLDYIEKLYNAITNNNCDIAVACMKRQRKKTFKYRLNFAEEKVYTDLQEKLDICRIPACCYACGKLFKTELIKDEQFKTGAYFEDVFWTPFIIGKANKLVTVPDIYYFYRTNNSSIVKTRPSAKKQEDCYNAKRLVANFYAENNLITPKGLKNLTKEIKYLFNIPVLKTKVKDNIETKYLFSFLPISKKKVENTILVFNTSCFGDVLLCSSLCQNLKNLYPKHKLVFISDKPFATIAKNLLGVDEIVAYDKKGEHKGLIGFIKFIKDFKFKNPAASFVVYKNIRNKMISHFVGANKVIGGIELDWNDTIQNLNTNLLKHFTTQSYENLAIKSVLPPTDISHLNLDSNQKNIAICTTSKYEPKDMPTQTLIELVNILNQKGFNPLFIGTGNKALQQAEDLRKANCNFTDLINKTNLNELGQVLSTCDGLISVDTGTMHYGLSLAVPTVAIFYQHYNVKLWAPDPKLYKSSLITENYTAQNMFDNLEKII